VTTESKCELCGGKLGRNNRSGLCSRPECRRERQRRYYAANREKCRLQQIRYRLMHGVRITGRDKKDLVAHHSPNWRGGRICFCDICGDCLYWRSPSQIRPNGTFCKKHAQCWRKQTETK